MGFIPKKGVLYQFDLDFDLKLNWLGLAREGFIPESEEGAWDTNSGKLVSGKVKLSWMLVRASIDRYHS